MRAQPAAAYYKLPKLAAVEWAWDMKMTKRIMQYVAIIAAIGGLIMAAGAATKASNPKPASKPADWPAQTDVFVSGQGGYNTCRIPAAIVTPKGTLLAFCEGRVKSRSDAGDIDLLVRRSSDGGKTWGDIQVVWNDGANTCGNPCPVIDRVSGTICLLMTWNRGDDGEGAIKKGTAHDSRRVFITRSTDDGATWSKPAEITADAKHKGWRWYATGPGVGIQLTHGPHAGRLVVPCDHSTADGTYGSHTIYSDDAGKTWKRGEPILPDVNECQVVELSDGTLLMNMRNYAKSQSRLRAVATSADGGATWSKVSYDAALPEPVCQASIIRYDPAKGAIKPLLFSNPASKERRERMTVRASFDEGKSWPVAKLIYGGPAAYSCLTVLPDGTVGLLYELDGSARISFARIASDVVAPAGGKEPVPAREDYLMLDSRLIDTTDNARLAVGTVKKHPANPLFKEDKPWEPRFDNLYTNIIYDDQEKLYKCWYSPFIVDRASSETPSEKRSNAAYRPRGREMGVCYATSKDGLAWDKPELGLVEFQGAKANNLVVRGPHGAGVFKDANDKDPTRRYKMFYKGKQMSVRFSADGLRWSDEISCGEIAAAGDTHNNAFWCPERNCYVGITRLWDKQRLVGRTESPDFRKWTKAVEVMRGDEANQIYAMPVFRHADVYLGLVMIYCPKPDRVHCELAWSPDTLNWHRIDTGTPLIPLSANKGDNDWGCAYAAACPVFLEDETRLYYSASNGTHSGWRDGFLALATLRPDGFAGYEPLDKDKPANVLTQPVRCSGRNLRVTADAKGGSLRATVLDANDKPVAVGELITDDVTKAAVTFAAGADLTKLTGQDVRLKFDLTGAKLFAFAFSD